jgi:hypothetical protein
MQVFVLHVSLLNEHHVKRVVIRICVTKMYLEILMCFRRGRDRITVFEQRMPITTMYITVFTVFRLLTDFVCLYIY